MLTKLSLLWRNEPLKAILLFGLLIRLIAAFFAQGYGMHDDHFSVIEAAGSWADGADYDNWLPWNSESGPAVQSLFYPGLHYLLFSFLQFFGLDDPQWQMLIVRILHAVYSLSVIWLGYKITAKISDVTKAKLVGILLAGLWLLPWLSVHNMVEYASVPPVLLAIWLLIRHGHYTHKIALYAGLVAGVAVGVRFQAGLFILGIGIAILMDKRFWPAVLFGLGAGFTFFLTQFADIILWGYPFAALQEYIHYNLNNEGLYLDQPWFLYFFTVPGLMLFPVGLYLFFGFFRMYKRHLLLFIPAVVFFIFHSYFPNKQERFIVSMLPIVIILGTIGWEEWRLRSKFWQKRTGLYKGSLIFFAVINLILLLAASTAYTKKSRVEAMAYLYKQGDVTNFIWENSHRTDYIFPPQFFADDWRRYSWVTKGNPLEYAVKHYDTFNRPNYIIFSDTNLLDKRLAKAEKYFDMEYKVTLEAGFLDYTLHWLNKHNHFETYRVYKINGVKFDANGVLHEE